MPFGRGEQDDPSFGRSEESRAVGHGPFGADQYDRTVRIGETQHEYFGHEGPDLFHRKVDHGCDLTPDQGVGGVVHSQLGQGLPLFWPFMDVDGSWRANDVRRGRELRRLRRWHSTLGIGRGGGPSRADTAYPAWDWGIAGPVCGSPIHGHFGSGQSDGNQLENGHEKDSQLCRPHSRVISAMHGFEPPPPISRVPDAPLGGGRLFQPPAPERLCDGSLT